MSGNRGKRGRDSAYWEGGRHAGRYVRVYRPSHPQALPNGYIYEHIALAEQAVGGLLPAGAEVHHVNGDGCDNSRGNLVVCQGHAYHMLLHRRSRALEGAGNADWLKCGYCGEWGDPEDLHLTSQNRAYHKHCKSAYDLARRPRTGVPRGEAQHSSKLTAEQVVEIRARYEQGGVSQYTLAEEYGVARSTLAEIVRRETWTHI